MNLWTLPRRIQAGFALLVLIAILVGLLSLWRIHGISRNVATLADNAVPSVVSTNRIIQANLVAARSVRRAMLDAIEKPGSAGPSIEATERVIREGDELVAAYPALISNDTERQLFREAVTARDSLLEVVRGAVRLIREGKADDSRILLRDRLDGGVEESLEKFNAVVKFNADNAGLQAADARDNVRASTLLIALTLGAALLVAALLAALIVRAATRSLLRISEAIEGNVTQTSTASGQLSAASQALATGCSEQGSSVAETSASLEQMSTMIKSTADNAAKAKELAGQARTAAETGAETMATMNEAMKAIETSSAEVAKIVKNIDEIAFQTNILALNAAVEAARAGEAGAGFAVVADEVRALAQRSAAAARETADRIEAAIAKSRHGSASCGRVGESLAEIAEKVSAADVLVAEIATAAHEQTQGIRQIGLAMTQLDNVTRGIAGRAEESASAAVELSGQAHLMQESVEFLRGFVGRRDTRGTSAARLPAAPSPERSAVRAGPSRSVAAPAAVQRPATAALPRSVRIPMPGDAGVPHDSEDRNFSNF
jgi:methyl-accepting chemotaxis protein